MRHLSFPTPKSLSLTFIISSRMEYWFCFTIWLIQGRRGEFQRLPLFLLNYSSYYPRSQGTNVGVKPTPSMFITIVYSGSGERTTRWFSEPSGLTVSQTQARIPCFTWPQYASTQTGCHDHASWLWGWSMSLSKKITTKIIEDGDKHYYIQLWCCGGFPWQNPALIQSMGLKTDSGPENGQGIVTFNYGSCPCPSFFFWL